jgi:hypothetical protein
MITSSSPMEDNYSTGQSQQSYSNNNDDDAAAASGYGNDANGYNANGYGNSNSYANGDATDVDWSTQYPSSAVNFQMVVSFVL